MENISADYVEQLISEAVGYLPNLITALLVFIAGSWIIKIITGLINRALTGRNMDPSVAGFFKNLIKWVLKIFLFIVVISQLGIQTTSFVAMLGAAGLAVGLALQGSLANFAGGVLIILFKPFKVGHYINAQGIFGTVKEISIFTTTLSTDNNQLAIIPNGELSNQKIINYSTLPFRKEIMNVGVSYNDDIKKAKDVILKLAEEHPKTVKEEQPAPKVVVSDLGESAVILQLQYWTKTSDFWGTHWEMLENIKYALDEAGISMPYPQRDVRVIKE